MTGRIGDAKSPYTVDPGCTADQGGESDGSTKPCARASLGEGLPAAAVRTRWFASRRVTRPGRRRGRDRHRGRGVPGGHPVLRHVTVVRRIRTTTGDGVAAPAVRRVRDLHEGGR